MELRQLRYLVGVSEAGSLLGASRTLHIAQPALSQHIAALEAELGARLFTRSNRGMHLTEAGRRFVEHTRIVLADVERAKSAVREVSQEVRGDVALGLPTTVALVATLPVLQAVRERYPEIRLKLVESHSGYLREWLLGGRLDLAVLFGAGHDAAIDTRPLLEERLVWVTSAARPPAAKQVSLRAAAAQPMVLPGKDHGLRRIVDAACARQGLQARVVAEIDSLPQLKKAVAAGLAGTVLSPGSVSSEVEAGQLAFATIHRPHLSRQVLIATSVTRPVTPAAAAVRDLVAAQMRALVASKVWPARWVG